MFLVSWHIFLDFFLLLWPLFAFFCHFFVNWLPQFIYLYATNFIIFKIGHVLPLTTPKAFRDEHHHYSTTTTQDRTVDRRSLLTHFQQSACDHQALFIFCLLNHFGIHSLFFTSTPDSTITPLHFPYSLAKNPHPHAFQSSSLNHRPTFPNQSSFPWPLFTPLSGKITPPRNPLACLLRHHCHSMSLFCALALPHQTTASLKTKADPSSLYHWQLEYTLPSLYSKTIW